jgi:hypothetical protein
MIFAMADFADVGTPAKVCESARLSQEIQLANSQLSGASSFCNE